MQESVRLHISPFTPDLLPLILPPALQNVATDISFHDLPNFPERKYGFVSLPTMEAQRLRKKVNGSILRGAKVKVEEARPKKAATSPADGEADGGDQVQERGVKKRKRQEGVIPAYELKDERKVKRGWTEPATAKIREKRDKKGKDKIAAKAGKKRQEPSKHTDVAECLFKTEIPPNKRDPKTESTSQQKRKKSKSTVVHEFEHTEKHPTFIRSSASTKNPTAKYDEQKGWVDASGAVVEPKKIASNRETARGPPSPSSDEAPAVDHERLGSLTLREQNGEEEEDDDTSSSGVSTSESSSGSSEVDVNETMKAPPRPSISVSPAPEKSVEQPAASKSASVTPHPLEALYKKPALPSVSSEKNKANLSVEPVTFSFFNSEESTVPASAKNSIETSTLISPPSSRTKRGAAARLPNLAIPPSTPFTQRDMSWRAQRSAAPTPDTAMPGRGWPNLWSRSRGSRVSTEEIEEEEDQGEVLASVEATVPEADEAESAADPHATESDDEDNSSGEGHGGEDDTPLKSRGQPQGQSDFTREFYEKRGEFNRSWKQARREATKSQRSAANRQRKA